VAKDEELDLMITRVPVRPGESQQPAQDQVQDREEHPRMLRNRCDGARSESFRPLQARTANRDQAFTGSADLAGSTLLVSSDTTLRIDHQGSVEVEADDVTLDCAGHTISGPGTRAEDEYGFIGILLDGRTGVTVKNCRVSGFDYGILLTARLGLGSDGNRLIDNAASENFVDGIRVTESERNVLTGNIVSFEWRARLRLLEQLQHSYAESGVR